MFLSVDEDFSPNYFLLVNARDTNKESKSRELRERAKRGRLFVLCVLFVWIAREANTEGEWLSEQVFGLNRYIIDVVVSGVWKARGMSGKALVCLALPSNVINLTLPTSLYLAPL
jgi:hypothetical protein